MAILISDIADFWAKNNARDKGYFIVIWTSVHQEEVTIVNAYAPKNRASKYMKLTLRGLQRENNKPTIIAGNVNTFFSITDGHKINNVKK